MNGIIKFEELENSNLMVDALYKGGLLGNVSDDPLNKLLGAGNQGGFRHIGSIQKNELKLVIIYSSLSDPDWPDYLDFYTGQFIYFGDNKSPGNLLHETPKKGNEILNYCFDAYHGGERRRVPPFFVFTKGTLGRDVVFRGLAVPGAQGIGPTEDLVALWKSKRGHRFQNYKAIFTILDIPVIKRSWINDIKAGNFFSEHCPPIWKKWIENGNYTPLRAEKTIEHRKKREQIPEKKEDRKIIETIHSYFKSFPYSFEKCAAELVKLMDINIISCDVTRPWVDGGRDAIGKYRIGLEENSIEVDFALEAKCYNLNTSVRVKETSRLISRLRYRQFGIFVTTSYIHEQAYKEIKEDQHPVIVISANDIVKILKQAGYKNETEVKDWLNSNFPLDAE